MSNQEQHIPESSLLEQTDEPPMYTIVIHNDDYTPIEFVVELLMAAFTLSYDDAELITMNIHSADRATVGAFTHEVAETKALQCNQASQGNGFPLLAEIEQL